MNKLKRIGFHVLFWLVSLLFLSIFFGSKSAEPSFTITYGSYMLPVAIVTSYTFNYFLLPRFLFANRIFEFTLYSFFTIVFSLYLEMVILMLVFIYQANYSYDNLHSVTTDLTSLGVGLYFIIFLSTLIYLIKRWSSNDSLVPGQRKEYLQVRENRQMVPIGLEDIQYIESMDNYVKIHTKSKTTITKEKISKIAERLPDNFVRIHRSYIVNQHHISSYNREKVMISEASLPISRTYKKEALNTFTPATSSNQ